MGNASEGRKVVIVNQAVNYLTVDLCNAFADRFTDVSLITGSIHVQGQELSESVGITYINKWIDRPTWKKALSYLWASLQIYFLLLVRYRKYEVFFVSLPPMAYLLSLVLPHRCSMLIWDVYPDVFKITGMKTHHPIYKVWAWLNKKAFDKAFRLFTIGYRMTDLLSKYVKSEKISITPLWSIFQENNKPEKENNPFIIEHDLDGKFVVQYSGNIGLTHNVETMVELAELMVKEEDVLFQIIGRGPRKPYLKSLVKEKELPNCQFLPFQPDEMFPYSLSAADLGVVILDKLTSKGSVPSKSYNLMSYGIPSLYIASKESELYDYIQEYEHGKCLNYRNLQEAKEFILELKNDKKLWQTYAANSLKASTNFRRENADAIVAKYLS